MENVSAPPPQPIAVVGMDAHFADCEELDTFDRSIYDGVQHFRSRPKNRAQEVEQTPEWHDHHGPTDAPEGAYVDRYPPQQLMMEVAERAMQDAKLKPGGNVAVIITFSSPVQSDLQINDGIGSIGDVVSSRIATLWNLSGPTFSLNEGDHSVMQAVEAAQHLLETKTVDAVVLGAVDLLDSAEQVLLHPHKAHLNTGTFTWSYDCNASGWIVGEGAGAIVLKRRDTATAALDRIYATIDAISITQISDSSVSNSSATDLSPFTSSSPAVAVQAACHRAHEIAGIAPDAIDYLEVCGNTNPSKDNLEIAGLVQAYQVPKANRSCAMGSVTANFGYAGVAAGMASLIKTALCLYHRYIPAVPKWSAPKQKEPWARSPFYVAQSSRVWPAKTSDYTLSNPRRAAINQLTETGIAAHVILSEDLSSAKRESRYLEQRPFYLFAIATDTRLDLQTKITALQTALATGKPLARLASQTFCQYQQQSHLPYVLTLTGKNQETLAREIQRAFTGAAEAFETGKDWQTPAGSYFTVSSLAKRGKVAFVYPGAFNSYVGQCKDYFRLFPQLHNEAIIRHTGDRHDKLSRYLYPRSLKALSRRKQEAFDQKLLSEATVMLEADMAAASFTTAILQKYFRIQPQIAFGYSLGETNMMIAQGIFATHQLGAGNLSMHESPLLSDRLSGPRNAIREYWGLPTRSEDSLAEDSLAKNGDEDLWSIHVLLAPVSDVKQAIGSVSRAYLTQINTPNEVVIAGEPEACKTVIQALGCPSFRAPFDHVIHCPPMASEKAALEKLHALTIPDASPIEFYTAATCAPIALDQRTISQSIAKGVCQTLDFPRLVNQVYADGARVFVEVGAGSSCSRYIGEILKGRPHLTTMLNLRGMDDHTALIRALSRLVSHRVPIDLSPLYPPSSSSPALSPQPANNTSLYQTHATFLQARKAALQRMKTLISLQLQVAQTTPGSPEDNAVKPAIDRSTAYNSLAPVGEPTR